MKVNAKDELLENIENKRILCATIGCELQWTSKGGALKYSYDLKLDYFDDEYQLFLSELDFEYHVCFNSQYLFGIVWLTDGTWLERCNEHNGKERWKKMNTPEIPDKLK